MYTAHTSRAGGVHRLLLGFLQSLKGLRPREAVARWFTWCMHHVGVTTLNPVLEDTTLLQALVLLNTAVNYLFE
jgi:hypothetical protein